MNPRETAVRFDAPSPNQIRSFKKNPFGIPLRTTRVARPEDLPAKRPTIDSHEWIIEAIIVRGVKGGAVGPEPVEMPDHSPKR
jgi:hypothetical protein